MVGWNSTLVITLQNMSKWVQKQCPAADCFECLDSPMQLVFPGLHSDSSCSSSVNDTFFNPFMPNILSLDINWLKFEKHISD